MANLFSLTVEWLAAAMLLLLWFQDRSRGYLLWWAVANAALPCLSIAGRLLRVADPADALSISTFYALTAAVMAATQAQGVLLYRGLTPSRRACAWVLGVWLGMLMALVAAGDVALLRLSVALSTGVVFLGTAVLLWPLGQFERLTAALFFARSLLGVVAATVIAQRVPAHMVALISTVSALLVIASAFLVVVMVFNRLLTDLREHSLFHIISKEIVTALQGLMDEREMARRVIDLLVRYRHWDIGALVLHHAGEPDFEVAYTSGQNMPPELLNRFERLPVTGLSAVAFNTRRLVYSMNAAQDPRLNEELREAVRAAGTATQICIPLVHDDVALGVLILRDRQIRALLPHEVETMESLGRVIGMSLTHLRNLATMSYRAMHDVLTGLDNRAALHEWFSQKPADHASTLMLFDLNGFKEVNDSLGHAVGDELLKALSLRLQQSLASAHVRVFRLGGDEFVILYDDVVDAAHSTQRAQALAELIAQPFHIGGVWLRTSASIGIAESPRHGTSSHDLLRCADLAMYQAKNSGWPIAVYEQGRDEDVRDRMQLVSGVADALEREQFELYYQPLVALDDGRCSGCEALLRWHHPERGLLGAHVFMPPVEATDLIHPLTQRVAELAIRDAARWQADGMPIKVSINLSARNLLDANLPELLQRLTREHALDPASLQLEITESVLMKDPIAATAVLQRLHDAGFTIALDDFGTGYSSLEYLARFPIHTLKIDQSFVRNMTSDRRSRSIVQSTVELAHMLDLTVIAEGVEGASEAQLLADFGCDVGQGYLYAKPLQKSELERWWRERRDTGAPAV